VKRYPYRSKYVSSCQSASDSFISNCFFYKFSIDELGLSRPSTPNIRTKIVSDSRPSTPTSTTAQTHPLHPKQPIQTPQQFYDWFALIDRSVAHSQESHFRAHVASVAEHLETCDRLVERIDEVDAEVGGMLEGWRGVEEGGRSLKDACERLLEERVRHEGLFIHSALLRLCIGQAVGADGRYRSAPRVFQGIGIRDTHAQPPWRIPRSPD
jgi:hypothetical protein